MKLYLVQHGQAMTKEQNPDRPLTEQGRQDSEKVASLLQSNNITVHRIYHSGKLRVQQTAEIFASHIQPNRIITKIDNIKPNDSIMPLRHEIDKLKNDTMVAGHLPFMSKISSNLLTGQEDRSIITFKQGGVVCLELQTDKTWNLLYAIIPSIL